MQTCGCGELVLATGHCPACGARVRHGGRGLYRAAGAALLGLTLTGCPKDKDDPDPSPTATDDTGIVAQPEYGVPDSSYAE